MNFKCIFGHKWEDGEVEPFFTKEEFESINASLRMGYPKQVCKRCGKVKKNTEKAMYNGRWTFLMNYKIFPIIALKENETLFEAEIRKIKETNRLQNNLDKLINKYL